ncbi:MAG: hypothetical protein Q7J09_11255 [Methanocalculus sp.]|uniref:hypothetical protein n=1 Tax=Methanocalculus sp. TaxID=2004547 RepID=UPI002726F27F|nr:hypothetical protein [Methanocalculus sp.]MDO8842585.1 hypothetical protein [Methanocalculus sp.]MDO9540560.1 hypothetical protein [Methanocalculus sp.]
MIQIDGFDLFFLFLGVCMIIGAGIVGLMTLGYEIVYMPVILFVIAMLIAMVAIVVILRGYSEKKETPEE